MKLPEQAKRLGLLIGIIVLGTLVTRFYLLPRPLVSTELQRAFTVERWIATPIKFAGSETCQACHEDVAVKKAKGFHKNLSCEGCHGPAVKHAENPGEVKPSAPRDRKACPVCHAYDASRPTGFPQINPVAHNPLKPCITCHNPHEPVPPRTPAACAACHAQIERTKAISSHALLECTTCHTTPARHKTMPRTALPSKPEAREFCAKCHGKDATLVKEAPKIDLSTHGGTFRCWECHYPHLPEGRTEGRRERRT